MRKLFGLRQVFGLRQAKVCLAAADGQSHGLAAQSALYLRAAISSASAPRTK